MIYHHFFNYKIIPESNGSLENNANSTASYFSLVKCDSPISLRPLCNNKLSSQTSGSLEHISRLLLSMPQLRPRTAPYGRDSNQRHKHHGICCSKISLPYL
uniref:Ovule protein n=1 Tax=Bursaphelenchus xylophilus TaxID=6326 RepID=A0A1I7SNB5_BURXY